MTRPHWRLVNMWEGEPVRVDPKRPLVGFALVAVLCAVLMTLSVARGSASFDLVHRGRPIAVTLERTPVQRVSDAPAASTRVEIPVELAPQPIGVAAAAPLQQAAATP